VRIVSRLNASGDRVGIDLLQGTTNSFDNASDFAKSLQPDPAVCTIRLICAPQSRQWFDLKMNYSSPGRLKLKITRAFIVLLALGGAAPSQVRAACGHIDASKFGRSTRILIRDLALEQIQTSERFDWPTEVPLGDRPCSGLSCSRGRDLPNAPASPLSSHSRSDDGCCATGRPEYSGEEFTEYQTNPANPHPQRRSSPVERPPRP
jgi:hypothetical protein